MSTTLRFHGAAREVTGSMHLIETNGHTRDQDADPQDDDVRILISHMPDPILELKPNTRIDLLIAGHTHGGQVQLPFFGPPITLSRIPRRAAAGGLHELNGRCVYVSRGVGCERGQAPRLRFLCPPEISILDVGDD